MKGFLEARVKGVSALMPGRVEAHLAHLFATESGGPAEEREQRTPQAEVSSNEPGEQKETPMPKQLPTSLSPEQRSELTQQNEARHDWIEQLGAQDRSVTQWEGHTPLEIQHVSVGRPCSQAHEV